MPEPIKIRASLVGDVLDVRALLTHPMETGQRRDPQTNQLVPAHYIETARITVNGKAVIDAELGPGVARNPVLAFKIRGAKIGDKLIVSWQDNKGETRADTATVSDGARN